VVKPSQVAMSMSKNNVMGNVPNMSGRYQAEAIKMSSNNYNGVQSFKSGSSVSLNTNFKVASQNAFTRQSSSGFFGTLASPFSVLNKSKNLRCQPVKAMTSNTDEPEFTIKSNITDSGMDFEV
jgi:hypothetical protein